MRHGATRPEATLEREPRGGGERAGGLLDRPRTLGEPVRAEGRVLGHADARFGDAQRRDLLLGLRLELGQPALDQEEEDARRQQEREHEGDEEPRADAPARVETPPETLEGDSGHWERL